MQVDVEVAKTADLIHQSAGVLVAHMEQPAAAGTFHVHVVMAVFAADNLICSLSTAASGKAGNSAFFD